MVYLAERYAVSIGANRLLSTMLHFLLLPHYFSLSISLQELYCFTLYFLLEYKLIFNLKII